MGMKEKTDVRAQIEQRVKLLKLLWDAIGTEFGGRGELYEINWSGSTENGKSSRPARSS